MGIFFCGDAWHVYLDCTYVWPPHLSLPFSISNETTPWQSSYSVVSSETTTKPSLQTLALENWWFLNQSWCGCCSSSEHPRICFKMQTEHLCAFIKKPSVGIWQGPYASLLHHRIIHNLIFKEIGIIAYLPFGFSVLYLNLFYYYCKNFPWS